ncbi:MAG TPA: GNAT family N-acetyltransferase [Acidimicrobiales bacterium]
MGTVLHTDRLILRPLRQTDLAALKLLHAEPSFWWFPLGRGQNEDETEAFLGRVFENYESGDLGLEAVVVRDTGDLAGWAGLSVPAFLPDILPAVEVGWRLGSAWRGRGYATEAGAAWVRQGFENLGLERIVSIYEVENRSSGRVIEKLGFELDRIATIPTSQVEVHVTALSLQRWTHLRSERTWPLPPSET